MPETPAQVPPVQTNDVAAGAQLAVSTEVSPAAMDAGVAVTVHTGTDGVCTATVAFAEVPVPAALTPDTVYVVVAVGVTVQVVDVVPAQEPPVQTNEVAVGLQVAVKTDVPPATIDAGTAANVQLDTGVVTVTVAVAATPVPLALTPAKV